MENIIEEKELCYTKQSADLKMEKFVSVIIPTYNREKHLRKAIDSVLNQLYEFIELIVVDDGSDDNTADLIAGYQKKNRFNIIYIRQENQGPAAARNRGVANASHELIAFLDSDDWFDENKLAVQVAAMNSAPEYFISHTQETWYQQGQLLNQRKKHKKESGYIFDNCLRLCAVSMSTVMLKKTLFARVGYFDEELRCCEDYDFWLRVSVDYPFLLIDRALTFKEGGRPDQVSFAFRKGMDKYRVRAIEKIFSSSRLSPEQYQSALIELTRKCRIYGSGCIKHGRIAEGRSYLALPGKYELGI